MLRDTPAMPVRRIGGSQRPFILEMLACIRGGTRIAVAVGLLACFGAEGLWASTDPVPSGLTVHRSTRAVPHRFTVHPDRATVPVNQTQRFEVTDAQGKPVAVHWNVSGIGCFGAACGTIDKQGVYRTPSSLPHPRVVIVEAVLVADPNYSVLTQVRLEDAAPVSPASAPVSAGNTQQITAPVVARQNVARSPEPPLPSAVAAAPVVARQNVARSPESPLPSAVAAAPVVARQNVARSPALPLPSAVDAAPVVGRQTVARNTDLPPLPSAVAAAPVVGKQTVARNADLPPLPPAVAAAPAAKKPNVARSTELPLLLGPVSVAPGVGKQSVARSPDLPPPSAVAAAPVVGSQSVARSPELPPLPSVVAAAPVVGRQSVARNTELPLLPNAVAAAPVVGNQSVAHGAELPPLPVVVAAAPTVGRQSVAHVAELPPLPSAVAAAPTVGRQNVPRSAVLPPLPDDGVAAARAGTVVGTPGSPVVTYQNGQLTIVTETSTLAEVLKLVAEKTGAEIDVPPGTGLDRVIEHAGPGRPEDVLASLLNGSSFDFVIVSSPQPPHDPTQVLLFLHRPATPAPLEQTVSASAQPQTVSASAPQTASASAQPKTPNAPLSAVDPSAAVTPPPADHAGLPPKEALTPEALGQLMKEKVRQLHDQIQQQQQSQQ
jgi:hypothetical protein